MKKLFFLSLGFSFVQVLHAQEPADALRYSWSVPGGTARTQAIGGAIGALGGDVSVTFINPAGLGFYRSGDLVLSPIFQMGRTKGTYNGRTESEKRNKFTWGTTGVVFGGSTSSGNISSASLALAYNRTADFNSYVSYGGANNTSSYAQKYIEELNNSGIRDSSASYSFPFGSSLALNTFWLDPEKNDDEVIGFTTNSPIGSGLLQRQTITSRGGINEFALGGAVNLRNKVYIGATLGVPVLNYHRQTTFVETDATDNPDNNFNYASVEDNLRTQGVGVNLKLGLIYKPQENLRLGLAMHTPTLYSLTENYDVTLTTDTENYAGLWTDYSTDYTNGAPSEFKYNLVTPFRAIASAAYVLREVEDVSQQRGFITADVEYVSYKGNSFQPSEENMNQQSDVDYLKSLNQAIDNAYKGALNFRLGGELKFTTFMVRGGVAYYGNPYQNINGEKASRMNLSGGLGYRDKGFFADLTYVHSIVKDVHFPYRLEDPAKYFGADIRSNLGNVLMTIGFKF